MLEILRLWNHCQLGETTFHESILIFLFILYGFQMVSLSDQPLWKRCVWLCNISPTCELASSSLPSVSSSTAFSLSFSTSKSSPRSNNETFIPKVTWADDGRCYPIHSQVIVYDRQMENFIKSNVKAALTCGDFPTTVSVMIAFFIGNLQNSLDEKTLLWIE